MLAKLEAQETTVPQFIEPRLSPRQRLALKVYGRALLRYERRENWLRALPIYAARCDRHGLYEDYPHGWKKELECPHCLRERVERAFRRSKP
jgi:hypothetical protein